MFKVISNKMSRPGFHPDLLPQVQRGSQTPGGCVSTSVLILGVKRCSQSSSHSRNVFLYVHIRNGPLEAQLSAWGGRESQGDYSSPREEEVLGETLLLPPGMCTRQTEKECHPLVPASSTCSQDDSLSRKVRWPVS